MIDEVALYSFLLRILGWSAGRATAIESAIRAIHLSVTCQAALVLLGDIDLAPVAHGLHLRTLGAHRPFILCNPRRVVERRTSRSLPSRASGVEALEAARGGTLCIRASQRPRDFKAAIALARDPATNAQIVVCGDARHANHPFLILPPPIRVPSLKERTSELGRIIDEYAADAIVAQGVDAGCFTDADRDWVLQHACESLAAIETATQRLVALRASRSTDAAAEVIGMAGAALRKWRSERRRGGGGGGVRQNARWMRVKAAP
ncbi:MAG TPA: hypothetical protein VN253_16940 [Kofleriaceae bacterium]|nr:hypothetical protein [Kofleriaceae bacterium]